MDDELRKAAQDFADSVDGYENDLPLSAIRAKGALRAALAKNANAAPQDDPKSVDCERCGLTPELHTPTHWCDNQSFQVAAPPGWTALFTAPVAAPQREWQSLTPDEINNCAGAEIYPSTWAMAFARAIESKLKEKNHE